MAIGLLALLPVRGVAVSTADDAGCASPSTAEGVACYEAAVRELLQLWVVAWAEADADTYLGLYDHGEGSEESTLAEARSAERRAWLAEQQDVVITLDLESMGIDEDGGVDVVFVQHYRSASRMSSLRKQLFLGWFRGELRITREIVLDR